GPKGGLEEVACGGGGGAASNTRGGAAGGGRGRATSHTLPASAAGAPAPIIQPSARRCLPRPQGSGPPAVDAVARAAKAPRRSSSVRKATRSSVVPEGSADSSSRTPSGRLLGARIRDRRIQSSSCGGRSFLNDDTGTGVAKRVARITSASVRPWKAR